EKQHHHAVPLWLLTVVFIALLLLTGATVWVTRLDGNQVNVPSFNILMALLIAFVKAVLVCLIFMHLRWDSPFNTVIIICSLLFVSLFIAFTIIDSSMYKSTLTPPSGFTPSEQIAGDGAAPAH
ncbi:MAG TPA: cytochrome C oxidase subunit IV family protein, partial [Tepidisphaeraceae bacterium]|nr:cytochrome C oxidase subunit IV family protein [Tepidisphaeraceae bacterium]